MATIEIPVQGRDLEFDLDAASETWTADDSDRIDQLDEGDFPLVGTINGKRYELYSDGTYAEVEL